MTTVGAGTTYQVDDIVIYTVRKTNQIVEEIWKE